MMGWMPARWERGPRLLPATTSRQGFSARRPSQLASTWGELWALVKSLIRPSPCTSSHCQMLVLLHDPAGLPSATVLQQCGAPRGRCGIQLGLRHLKAGLCCHPNGAAWSLLCGAVQQEGLGKERASPLHVPACSNAERP